MDALLLIGVIAGALGYLAWRIFRRPPSGGCGSGCGCGT